MELVELEGKEFWHKTRKEKVTVTELRHMPRTVHVGNELFTYQVLEVSLRGKEQKRYKFLNLFGNLLEVEEDLYAEVQALIRKEKELEDKVTQLKANASAISQIKQGLRIKLGKHFNEKYFKIGFAWSYQEVEKEFEVYTGFENGFQRGICVSENKKEIVLVSIVPQHGSFCYHDHWDENGDFIYSGEGSVGDQYETRNNKALINASNDGKVIQLFIGPDWKELYYQGKFEVVDYEYVKALDRLGKIRKEYQFRLREKLE